MPKKAPKKKNWRKKTKTTPAVYNGLAGAHRTRAPKFTFHLQKTAWTLDAQQIWGYRLWSRLLLVQMKQVHYSTTVPYPKMSGDSTFTPWQRQGNALTESLESKKTGDTTEKSPLLKKRLTILLKILFCEKKKQKMQCLFFFAKNNKRRSDLQQ